MRRALGGLIMALAITHTTPADATFSASGAAAWDEQHTVSGLAAVATSGAYGDLSGAPVLAAVATSGAYSSLTGAPVLAAVATSGAYSSLTGTPSLAAVATSGAYSDLTGTPALAAVATSGSYASLTGTPSYGIFKNVAVTGQSTVVAATAAETLQVIAGTGVSIVTDASNKTLTISAPAGAGITLQDVYPVGALYIELAGQDPATTFGFGTWELQGRGQMLVGYKTGSTEFGTTGQTGGATGLSYTPSGTNSTVSFTPSGTNAVSLFREAAAGTNAASAVTGSVSGDWPNVPTFAGTTASASASVDWPGAKPVFTGVTSSAHQHGVPFSQAGATATSVYFPATGSAWGVGTAINLDKKLIPIGATGTNFVAVTSALAVMLSQTAGSTIPAGTVSWPASVPQARVTGLVPAGVISWPATAPSAVAKTLTAAAQIFTGVTGSVSAQTFTGVAGTVPAQTFTGVTKSLDVLNPYIVAFFWRRTA